ncbi:MAG: 4Fe-4S cluster-binding domain-containing protein, partial [Lachnospiraceae bacterium]|nr:4Fe-4S cluster-binding domain-containing protein [Lachnospiraceae bacterium]
VVFCDNVKAKQGRFQDYEVYSVEKAVERFSEAVYLILNPVYADVMRQQLYQLGIVEKQIIHALTDEAEDYLMAYRRKGKEQSLSELQFEVDIVSHCNLNCKCCSQFSCIAEEEYINVEIMERDFKRLGELFAGQCKRIYLIGGEPLLHPNLSMCMSIARTYFPKGEISVFTNGVLLLKQKNEFWQICREKKISIIVTKYPITIDYEDIMKRAQKEQVSFKYFTTSEDFKFMINLGLDIDGMQDIEYNFFQCNEANNCIKLRDGKLYPCTRPAAIYRFNHYFGFDLQVCEADFIDIYRAVDKNEILRKLAEPIPFCRYCNVLKERSAMNWGKTEGKLEEWV